jgi:hypothetical protein
VASLQGRHQRICAIVTARTPSSGERPGQWTTFAEATKAKGCTCVPLYYVVDRHGGKLIRQAVGANRKEVERALDAHRGDVARRTYKVFRDVRFDEWGDQWLANLTAKPSTARVYGHSIAYAKQTFGAVKVRDLTTADVRQFLDTIRRAYQGSRAGLDHAARLQDARMFLPGGAWRRLLLRAGHRRIERLDAHPRALPDLKSEPLRVSWLFGLSLGLVA